MLELEQLVSRWSNGDDIALSEFGGVEAVIQAADEMMRLDPLTTVQVIIENWESFDEHRGEVVAILSLAAATENLDVVDEIHDALLCDSAVLNYLAEVLVAKIRRLAERTGILGDIATETWTRLALGGWSSELQLRAHLQVRAERSTHDGEVTIYLVRSVGAAMGHWGDPELVVAMTNIGGIDEFEADAAFELGMYGLGIACAEKTPEAALEGIRTAIEYLRQAEKWDGRLDARAYLLPLEGLLLYAEGAQISKVDAETARQNVNEYLLGYKGLNRHWRQGRADTSIGWSMLLGLLNEAAQSTTTHWFDPSAVIEAAASLYLAEFSIEMIARVVDDRVGRPRSVSVLIRPKLIESFSAHSPSLEFIDRWLDRSRSSELSNKALISAVESLRAEISINRGEDSNVSVGDGNPKAEVDVALREFFEHHAAIKRTVSLNESNLVRRVIADIERVKPVNVIETIADLTALVLALVQFTAFHLDQKQSGSRRIFWLGNVPDENGHYPKEHVLSDALSGWLCANGLRAQIEVINIGGGEVDLAVRFSDHSFYIEVKRVLSKEEDDAATAHYGDQASQYAATDVPIVFLALLDYARRSVRIDLDGAIWTRAHQPDPQSRQYALTGFRVQGNVEPPSASSRRRRNK